MALNTKDTGKELQELMDTYNSKKYMQVKYRWSLGGECYSS